MFSNLTCAYIYISVYFFQVETTSSICLSGKMEILNYLLSAEAADGLFGGIRQQVGHFLASREFIFVFCFAEGCNMRKSLRKLSWSFSKNTSTTTFEVGNLNHPKLGTVGFCIFVVFGFDFHPFNYGCLEFQVYIG